ncbi:AraC family transcriptional regulator [Bosea thiooxidans]
MAFPLEARGPDFVSRDSTATRLRLSELLGRSIHAEPLDAKGFEARLAGYDLADARIVWVDFPCGLKLYSENPRANLTVLLLERGSISFSSRSTTLTCPAGGAVALDTAASETITCEAGARGLLFTLPITTAADVIGTLFDRPAPRKLEIAAAFDAYSPLGTAIIGLLATAASGLHRDAPLRPSSHAARLLRDTVVTTLLEGLPHNYSDWFGRGQFEPVPWQIRQALDHIATHIDGSLTVQQVADAVGTSVRSLQQGFQRHRQTSPQAHLKAVRLARIRAELLDENARCSIEEIARRWGFVNRGHFALDYRQAFGELPSETRRSR